MKKTSEHIKYKSDGTPYYYYYQPKKGRKKKRGPKKRKPKKEKIYDGSWNYKIIQFDFKKQVKYIDKFRTLDEVEKKKQELISANNKIEFPVKFINNQRNNKDLYDFESEYVVLKKIKDKETENNESLLRNSFGKFVKHVTTSNNYYVYDKFPCLKEETFWVYGFNPHTNRKTYNWIYTNFIEEYFNDNYTIINVYLYNNKVIFRYGFDNIEFVVCKNISDAIRMYNMLKERYKNIKRVIFTGFVKGHSDRAEETIKIIKDKTGWELSKIYRTNTKK